MSDVISLLKKKKREFLQRTSIKINGLILILYQFKEGDLFSVVNYK